MYGLKKDPEIQAGEVELAAIQKAQGYFRNYEKSAQLHVEAADLFEKAKNHLDAARNYYEAASVLRLQKPAKISYTEIVKHLKKALRIYRNLLDEKVVKIYEELIEIFTEQVPNNGELAKFELEMGDYYITTQEYVKGIRSLESGKSRNVGDDRVSLVEKYLPLAGVYIEQYQMFKKAAGVYRECITLYLSHSTSKYAATKLIFSYGLALIAFEVSNKDEPDEVNEQTKKANKGFAPELNIADLTLKLSDSVFKENDIDRLREGTFLAGIMLALSENDKEAYFRQLGKNVQVLNTDQWQTACLSKIRAYFEQDNQQSIL